MTSSDRGFGLTPGRTGFARRSAGRYEARSVGFERVGHNIERKLFKNKQRLWLGVPAATGPVPVRRHRPLLT